MKVQGVHLKSILKVRGCGQSAAWLIPSCLFSTRTCWSTKDEERKKRSKLSSDNSFQFGKEERHLLRSWEIRESWCVFSMSWLLRFVIIIFIPDFIDYRTSDVLCHERFGTKYNACVLLSDFYKISTKSFKFSLVFFQGFLFIFWIWLLNNIYASGLNGMERIKKALPVWQETVQIFERKWWSEDCVKMYVVKYR